MYTVWLNEVSHVCINCQDNNSIFETNKFGLNDVSKLVFKKKKKKRQKKIIFENYVHGLIKHPSTDLETLF